MVAAPSQLVADRGFAGAGNAFDQVVFDTHVPFPIEKHAAVEFFPRFEWLRTRRLGFRFRFRFGSKADISE